MDNLLESTDEVNVNERMKIDKRGISDWMYVNKTKVWDGYKIRLLRERMEPAEITNFDNETGWYLKFKK